jgi:Protein of unknown function (DUF3105)
MAGTTGGGRGPGDNADRRPTKAERREDARLQREEIQRGMSRRRRNRRVGLVLVVVALAIAVVAVFLTNSGDSIPKADDLLAQASAAQTSAGCDAVQTTKNYNDARGDDPDIDHTHIGPTGQFQTPPALSTYPTVPPASGPHDPSPLPAGIYDSPPSIFPSIHAMEHGGVIIWYSPDADAKAVADLKAFYGQQPSAVSVGQDRVIIAPYDYPDEGAAGQLPAGVQMALVAWHRLQTCTAVNMAVAFDFTSQYEFPVYDGRTWKGVAREPGGQM